MDSKGVEAGLAGQPGVQGPCVVDSLIQSANTDGTKAV